MKELFPIYEVHKDLVYLDSSASSLKPKMVIDAVSNYYNNYSCNIERGIYKICFDATRICEDARQNIASYLNVDSEEIIFTRGASSSLNMVASMLKDILKEGDEVIVSELEHHSSFLPFLRLSKTIGIKLVFVELTPDGHITVENFKKALSPKTKVVALTHVSNVLGYITPIKEIIELSHKNNIIVSVDGAQAIPHFRVDLKDLDADFYSFSFHKCFGPTGLGVLYGKKKYLNMLEPVELGGEMNSTVTKDSVTYKDIPYKFEAGTMPIAEIFGASKAIDFLRSLDLLKEEEKAISLRNIALSELKKMDEIIIYNDTDSSSIISFNIKGVHSHDAVSYLSESICLRAGQHCAEPLHNFLGVNATLRASFYYYNDLEDVKVFISKIKDAINFFKEVGLIV